MIKTLLSLLPLIALTFPLHAQDRPLMSEEEANTNTKIQLQDSMFGSILLEGEAGPTQFFSRAKVVRCHLPKNENGDPIIVRGACKEVEYFNLNEKKTLPIGFYLVGFENSIFPGILEIKQRQTLVIRLSQIQVPETLKGQIVKVHRDLTNPLEQKKLFLTRFLMEKPFFYQTKYYFGDFYLPSWPQKDLVQRLQYSYCDMFDMQISQNASLICAAWSDKNYENLSSLFEFNENGTFKENWVSFPGHIFPFQHLRYLVSAPLSGGEVVSVLPGQYSISTETASMSLNIGNTTDLILNPSSRSRLLFSRNSIFYYKPDLRNAQTSTSGSRFESLNESTTEVQAPSTETSSNTSTDLVEFDLSSEENTTQSMTTTTQVTAQNSTSQSTVFVSNSTSVQNTESINNSQSTQQTQSIQTTQQQTQPLRSTQITQPTQPTQTTKPTQQTQQQTQPSQNIKPTQQQTQTTQATPVQPLNSKNEIDFNKVRIGDTIYYNNLPYKVLGLNYEGAVRVEPLNALFSKKKHYDTNLKEMAIPYGCVQKFCIGAKIKVQSTKFMIVAFYRDQTFIAKALEGSEKNNLITFSSKVLSERASLTTSQNASQINSQTNSSVHSTTQSTTKSTVQTSQSQSQQTKSTQTHSQHTKTSQTCQRGICLGDQFYSGNDRFRATAFLDNGKIEAIMTEGSEPGQRFRVAKEYIGYKEGCYQYLCYGDHAYFEQGEIIKVQIVGLYTSGDFAALHLEGPYQGQVYTIYREDLAVARGCGAQCVGNTVFYQDRAFMVMGYYEDKDLVIKPFKNNYDHGLYRVSSKYLLK